MKIEVERAFILNNNISHIEKVLYLCLLSYATEEGKIIYNANLEEIIAKLVGFSPSTIKYSFQALLDIGGVYRIKGRRNMYMVNKEIDVILGLFK